MPPISQLVQKNMDRMAANPNAISESPVFDGQITSPPLDLPVNLPQRGMFSPSVVMSSDRSDSSRAFRGAGQRSATFPFPPTPLVAAKTTTSQQTVNEVINQIVNNNIITCGSSSGGGSSGGGGTSGSISLQTDTAVNPNQAVLDLLSGNGITLTVDSLGGVQINGVSLKTDSVLNTLQTLLNLKSGAGIALTADGSGGVSIAATGTAGASIVAFYSQNLGGNVSVSSGLLTIVDSITITMPVSGGPFRVGFNYAYYVTGGVALDSYVTDGGNTWAADQRGIPGGGGNFSCVSGNGYSPVTYANGALVTFTVYTFTSGALTVHTSPGVGGSGPTSYLQAAIIPSN